MSMSADLTKLKAAFNDLDKKVKNNVIRGASRDSAKVFQVAALSAAPVDTGATRKAVKVRAAKKQKKGYIGVVCGVGEDWFKGDEFYAAFVEFGHHVGKASASWVRSNRKRKTKQILRDKSRQWVEGTHWLENAFTRVDATCKAKWTASAAQRLEAAVTESRKK